MAYLHELIQEAIDRNTWPLTVRDPEQRTYCIKHAKGAIWWEPQGTAVIMYAHQLISDQWQRIPNEIDWSKVRHGSEGLTRGGSKVRIVCTDCKDEHYPIIALVHNKNGRECSEQYAATGAWEWRQNCNVMDIVEITKY